MSEQKRTEDQKSNQKVRKYAYIVLIVAAVLLVLPLPIPRIKTLYGECIRHGETVKVEMRCVELCFLLFDDRMYGNWYIQAGEDGEVIRYVMSNHGVIHIPEESMDLLFIKLHRYREGQSSYVIHADYAKNQMLLSENQFDVSEDVEHLLAVSRDGDADAVVSYFPLGLSE